MNETRIADDFTDERYVYVTDTVSLDSLHNYYPVLPDDFTAAFVIVEDGDYAEVWVTESSRPYLSSTVYERYI